MEVLVDTTNICTSPKHSYLQVYGYFGECDTCCSYPHWQREYKVVSQTDLRTCLVIWRPLAKADYSQSHFSPVAAWRWIRLEPVGDDRGGMNIDVRTYIVGIKRHRVHSLGTPEFSSSLLRTDQMHLSYDFASSFSVDIHMLMLLNESKPMCTRVDFCLWSMTRVFCSLVDKFVGVHTCWSLCRLMNRLNPPVGSTTAAAGRLADSQDPLLLVCQLNNTARHIGYAFCWMVSTPISQDSDVVS